MAEERISGIEGVLGDIANMMGRKLDEHSKKLDDQGKQLVAISQKLDDQDIAIYDQTAIQRGHSRELLNLGKRLDKMDSRLDGMATKQDLEELRTQFVDSFKQVLAILDERLPKREE